MAAYDLNELNGQIAAARCSAQKLNPGRVLKPVA
jgi:hypothetical protein